MTVRKQKRLSLCIAAGNASKYPPDRLRELKKIADELIVADTGSGDGSIEPAEQAGADVCRPEWKGSWSEVRNFCLERAEGRWVLFLKPDETIAAEQLEELPSLLDNPNAEGYLLYPDFRPEDRCIVSPVQALRLFRNRREYRYRYRAFERIPDELLSNLQNTGIRIARTGGRPYSPASGPDMRLLRQDLSEHPEDCYLNYIYGIALLNRHKYGEGAAYLEKAHRDVNFGYLFAPHLVKCLGWSFIFLGQYGKAVEALEEGMAFFPGYSDLYVLRGEAHKQLGRCEKAVRDLENSLKIIERSALSVPAPEIDASVVLELLGELI